MIPSKSRRGGVNPRPLRWETNTYMLPKSTTTLNGSTVRPIKVDGNRILLIDQRKIPESTEYFDATNLNDMCFAIKDMVVRGAPAIGVAAALGLAAEARKLAKTQSSTAAFLKELETAKTQLQATRPTAVNLHWATEKVFQSAQNQTDKSTFEIAESLFAQATNMIEEDVSINMAIGKHGAPLLAGKSSVLTHCNAGALATCGWGTALGVIRSTVQAGSKLTVYVDETRPRQQGFRLTAAELIADNITPTLITDSMAGHLMSLNKVGAVIVGADRIAANGDAANKIGTYSLAVLAHAHNVPFYIAAPLSTIDPHINSGKDIPIEERNAEEVTTIGGTLVCPPCVEVYNPAFDVTPAHLITAIITEAGVLQAPYGASIDQVINRQ